MKAAIIGYGKMGREIERILAERGHETLLVIDADNAADLDAAHLAGVDVALEFTTPGTAYANIRTCIECGTAVVSGTTGWTDRLEELENLCLERGSALFYASNFCLGVNLMFRLNRQLAEMIGRVGGYDVAIEEVHHTQKKDAPSGTAITLAEGVLENIPQKRSWVNYAPGIAHAANRIEAPEAARPDEKAPYRAYTRWPTSPRTTASNCATRSRTAARWPSAPSSRPNSSAASRASTPWTTCCATKKLFPQ